MSNMLPITRYRPKGVGEEAVMVDVRGMIDAGEVKGEGFYYIPPSPVHQLNHLSRPLDYRSLIPLLSFLSKTYSMH